MKISRDQAICMFFYVEYTEENIKRYKNEIEKMDNVDICYNVDARQPIIVSKQRILGDPLTYRKYLESVVDSSSNEVQNGKRKRKEFETQAQVMEFLKVVYSHVEIDNNEIYHKQYVTTYDIYKKINEYTNFFEKRTSQSFAAWCRNNRLPFLNGKETRNSGNRVRELYVMEDAYYDDLIESICTYLPNYQASIKNLIGNGYEIVGYARKSPSNTNTDTRIRLLQNMINNLRERSFATRIYVSSASYSYTPFFERDLNSNSCLINKLEYVTGNTQDMLVYLKSVEHNVCLVSIDFSGLTSRSHDMIELIENNPSIKKIAIETFTVSNEIVLFDSSNLATDTELLEKFNCRKKIVQRSK